MPTESMFNQTSRKLSRIVVGLLLAQVVVGLAFTLAPGPSILKGRTYNLSSGAAELSSVVVWLAVAWAVWKLGEVKDSAQFRWRRIILIALALLETLVHVTGVMRQQAPHVPVFSALCGIVGTAAGSFGMFYFSIVLLQAGETQLAKSSKSAAWAFAIFGILFAVAILLIQRIPPSNGLFLTEGFIAIAVGLGTCIDAWTIILLWKFSAHSPRIRFAEVFGVAIVYAMVSAAGFGLHLVAPKVKEKTNGISVDAVHFPQGLKLRWTRELPERISGVTVLRLEGNTRAWAAVGETNVFLLDENGKIKSQFAHPEAPGLAYRIQTFEREGGDLLVINPWHEPRLVAFDVNGKVIWNHSMSTGDGADDMVTVRGTEETFLAVGHNGFTGLCLMDGAGKQRWCNASIGNVWFVSTLDCDGNGSKEILSLSKESHPYFGNQLGCYSLDGKEISRIPVPESPTALRTGDLDGDGRPELIAMWSDLFSTTNIAFWKPNGEVLREFRLSTEEKGMRSRLIVAHLRPGAGAQAVISLSNGWVMILDAQGQRWGFQMGADGNGLSLAAGDTDKDGVDELLVASDHQVRAWTWPR